MKYIMENKKFKLIKSIWEEEVWVDINQLTAYEARKVDDYKSVSMWFNGFYIIVEKETFDEIMEELSHGGNKD